ncbi:MAG TPA: UPF0149 family protein [Pseudomonadales bacterium]|nr:UPF0149 family protein [Pseudomonadales bacterium]
MKPDVNISLQPADAKGFLSQQPIRAPAGFVQKHRPGVSMTHQKSSARKEEPVATISHEQLTARLNELQLPVAAEALHGTIAGLACAGVQPRHISWIEQLSECLDGAELDDHQEAMAALHTLLVRDLADGDLGFQLLLPDSEEFLSIRARALARWTEGFVCGFVAVTRELSEDDREVINDIAAISQIDDGESAEQTARNRSELNNPENADSNERDFIELCEYVRLAAIELFRDSGEESTLVNPA